MFSQYLETDESGRHTLRSARHRGDDGITLTKGLGVVSARHAPWRQGERDHAGSYTRFHADVQDTRKAEGLRGRLVSRSGFRPFISNCGAALSRRASRASWSGRLLDDASDQYRRPASHWPLLLGAVENRPGDDGQEEAGGRWRRKRRSGPRGLRDSRADLPSFLPFSILPQPPAILCSPFWSSFSRFGCSFFSSSCDFHLRIMTFVLATNKLE